jgi:hypothetical protein
MTSVTPGGAITRRTGALLALGAVLMAGCGGSGSSTSDFVARADAICKRVNDRIMALGRPTTTAQLLKIGPSAIAYEQQALSQLGALKAPSQLSADWQKILADLMHLTGDATSLVAAVKANDNATEQKLVADSGKVQLEVTALASKHGLKECAKG